MTYSASEIQTNVKHCGDQYDNSGKMLHKNTQEFYFRKILLVFTFDGGQNFQHKKKKKKK